MSNANDAVSAALDAAISGDEAGSQTADKATPEAKTEDIVAKAAEEAIKAQSPSDEKPSAEEKSTGKDPVPYERFSEVIEQKNKALEQIKSLEDQFNTAREREDTLRNRLGALEQEHQILEAIRDLGQDERYKPAIDKIDRALRGIEDLEEEVEDAKAGGDNKAQAAAELKLAKKTEELEKLVHQQTIDNLWDKSQAFATKMLDALPEEYTDVDRSRLSKLWSPRVDWDSIEEQGAEAIPDVLRGSFAELIKEYGTPQGALKKQVQSEITQQIPEEARPSTPEDVVKGVMSKDWSEVKDGAAVLSDDEYAADIAKVLRATRGV